MSISDDRFLPLVIKLGLLKPSARFEDLVALYNKLFDSAFLDNKINAMPLDANGMQPDIVEALLALTPREAAALREEIAGVLPFCKTP